ncbi:MAG: TIGR03751 family conjugal transfer lipoprotein [Gammaproteobacteria bacterium]|nr:TIGR03751 family conjugal transfer lipoprotein [Gammaproteobacteria bacterium]
MVTFHRLLLLSVLISFVLGGCAQKSTLIPKSDKTMLDIYNEHQKQSAWKKGDVDSARERISRPSEMGDRDLEGYTRDADREIEQLFPKLPNPVLVMYVFPHLAGEGKYPVPGYSTAFSMYEEEHYALPGEVE